MGTKKRKNRLRILVCALIMACLLAGSAFGKLRIDPEHKCVLTVSAVHKERAIEGMEYSIYRAAAVSENGTYTLTEDFRESGETFNEIQESSEWKAAAVRLAAYVKEKQIQPTASGKTGKDGNAEFTDLDPGMYLVGESQITVGTTTYTSEPYLIALPNPDVKADEMLYTVKSSPKTEAAGNSNGNDSSDSDRDDSGNTETTGSGQTNDTETAAPGTPNGDSAPSESQGENGNGALIPGPDQENTAAKLPQTGQLKWPIPVLVVLGCGWIGLYLFLGEKRKKRFACLGVLFLSGAFLLQMYNLHEEDAADLAATEITAKLETVMQGEISAAPSETATITVDGDEYLGYLTIPALGLELPVMEEWSYPKLRRSPCRYSGNVEDGGLVIAAHNYKRHFGQIASLKSGDAMDLTDGNGEVHRYEVVCTEMVEPYEVDKMTSDDWNLTLFTCTYGGQHRIAVRCMEVKNENTEVAVTEK